MSYKLVILAGGYGTRISEESMFKPKPMIEIGGKPIIWHLMKYYSNFGIKEFGLFVLVINQTKLKSILITYSYI